MLDVLGHSDNSSEVLTLVNNQGVLYPVTLSYVGLNPVLRKTTCTAANLKPVLVLVKRRYTQPSQTYAVVAAKISTLLAFVTAASVHEKADVNSIVKARRAKGL